MSRVQMVERPTKRSHWVYWWEIAGGVVICNGTVVIGWFRRWFCRFGWIFGRDGDAGCEDGGWEM